MSSFNPKSMEPLWDSWYIDSLIGEGNYGSVYKIYREDFGVRYESALKIIPVPNTEAEAKQVFYDGMDEVSARTHFYGIVKDVYREIAIMAQLKGKSNIVSYEDHKIIEKQDEIGYYILIRMELLTSLDDYFLMNPCTIETVVKLGKDLCRALNLCQKRKLIHRDIKPANIFVSSDGDYKLGDFGIARKLEGTQYNLTRTGTFNYMAPEVYRSNQYDERVDIYSLGLVLYHYLNKLKIPFSNTNRQDQRPIGQQESFDIRMRGEKLPPPVRAKDRLAEVVLKACEYDPNNRYQTPEEFLTALETLRPTDLEERPDYDETILIPKSPKRDEDDSLDGKNGDGHKREENIEEEDKSKKGRTNIGGGNGPDSLPEDHPHRKKNADTKPLYTKILVTIVAACLVIGVCIGLILFIVRSTKEDDTAPETLKTDIASGGAEKDGSSQENSDTEQQAAGGSEQSAAKASPESESTEDVISSAPEPTEEPVRKKYAVVKDNSKLEDLSSIENVKALTSLDVSANSLSSLEELRESIWMDYLNIRQNNITELEPISGMAELTCLDASYNQISNINPLRELSSLEILILSNNRISSIDAIKNLKNLNELRIDGNTAIKDISAVKNLEKLNMLILSNTDVQDITPLYGLKNLIILDLSNTKVPEEQVSRFLSEVPGCDVTY